MENMSSSQESVIYEGQYSPQGSLLFDFLSKDYGISVPYGETTANTQIHTRLRENEVGGRHQYIDTLDVPIVVSVSTLSTLAAGPSNAFSAVPSTAIANQTTLPIETRQQIQTDIEIITNAFENTRGESSNNVHARRNTSSGNNSNDINLSRCIHSDSPASSLHNPGSLPNRRIIRNISEAVEQNIENISSSDGSESRRSLISSLISQQTPTTSGNKRRISSARKLQFGEKRRKRLPQHSFTTPGGSNLNPTPTTVESAVEADPNAQIVSVHRICVVTAKTKFGNKARDYDELKIIDLIVKIANDKIGENEEEDARTKTIYEKQDTCTPELAEEHTSLFFGQNFNCEVYVQNVSCNNKFLLQYGVRVNESHINCLVFYYRPGDIFALTTRHSWNVIQWCSDFDFPGKIAARLLSTGGKIKSTDKQLIGNVRTSTKSRKFCEEENPLEIKNICTNFVAEFRKNCSIYKFPCFDVVDTETTIGKGVKVEVGFGFVRIHKKLGMTDFLLILSHFSLVALGLPTHDPISGHVEKDSRTHRKYLTKVSTDLGQRLDSELLRKIYNVFHNSGRVELGNYYLCHKHTEDYSLASKVFLCIGKDKVKTFYSHPTLNQIIDFMMVSPMKQFQNLVKAATFNEFKTKFTNFKIGYTYKDREKDPEKIINYIEGDIVYNGLPYWKLITKWCSVAGDYIGVVHRLFQDVLKKHLLECSDEGQLKKQWPSLKQIRRKKNSNPNYDPIKDYIDLYKAEENFYTSAVESSSFSEENDGEAMIPTKLFDMLAIGDNGEMFIYIIQDGFNAKIRDALTQIQKSLITINKANFVSLSNSQSQSILSEDSSSMLQNDHPLHNFYLLHCHNNAFCQRFPDYDTFQTQFRNAKFIFAIADPPEELRKTQGTMLAYLSPIASIHSSSNNISVTRSLTKERDLASRITIPELEENIKSSQQFDLDKLQLFINLCHVPSSSFASSTLDSLISAAAGKMYEEFRNMKFVDQNGSVTSKLLLCTENQFQFKGLENQTEMQKSIFEVVKMYQSQYRNLLPKIEIIEIRKEILNASYAFGVCQIPL